MKWLFGFLLLLSIGLFAFMQWGGALTGTAKNGQTLGELNSEKIELLDMPAARQMPASAVLPLPQAADVSAPIAASAAAATAVSAPIPAPVAKAAAKACMEWGEFTGADLARADKALSELKLGDRLARRSVEHAGGYWVYFPPLKNQAAVNNKIEQIKAIGVEDYFVVQEPPLWVNAISLGVFKTQEAAKNHLVSLNKKGVRTAKMGERKRKLNYTVLVLNHIDADAAARLSELQKSFANSELTTVVCK